MSVFKDKTLLITGGTGSFGNAVASAGDMHPDKAEELLDDLSTDGEHIYSDKIQDFGNNLLHLTTRYGMDIPLPLLLRLNGR